jgi:SAM-dependent methyltransferase
MSESSVSRLPVASRPQFFMSLRDIGFWIRSARADAHLARLERLHGTEKAFDLLYSQSPDPWGANVVGYRYQRLKYEKLLLLLPKRHYETALDIGCGQGYFTRRLATCAESVLGIELSSVGVANAQQLSTDYANVAFQQGDVRSLRPALDRQFDLIVLADVLYYLSPLTDAVLKSVSDDIDRLLKPDGILLIANHFFFDFDAQSRHVREIHDSFRWSQSLERVEESRHPFFLASILKKHAATSDTL